jgi:hypothetical protein
LCPGHGTGGCATPDPRDAEIARLRDIIVELERWKSAAQLAWSICVETAPEDCPGPDAVRAEVDALDDRCIAAEGQVLVAATRELFRKAGG